MKFFQITSDEGILYGLDGNGQIWRGHPSWDFQSNSEDEKKWTWRKLPMPEENDPLQSYPDILSKLTHPSDPSLCEHNLWTDMEHGVGQCRQCMAMLPYAQFRTPPS